MRAVFPQDPKAFSINYNGISNRIISDIEIFEYFNPTTISPTNPPKPLQTAALWDTGATASIITRQTAQSLALTPTGKTITSHGGGQSEHLTYVVNILLPNKMLVAGITVTEMEKIVDNFGVIIGMDIIALGDFSLTHYGGQTCFSFRIPSLKKIDYVEEWNNAFKGIRGHDKCPCKSGKQFRKCHGQELAQTNRR